MPVTDLSELNMPAAAETGSIVELEHPMTSQPLYGEDEQPMTWTLRGMDSPQVRAVIRKQQNRRNQNIQKGRGADLDADTIEAEMIERLLAATITFSSNFKLDGETLAPSPQTARKLLTDPRFPWIAEQLNTALGDRKRFLTPMSNG